MTIKHTHVARQQLRLPLNAIHKTNIYAVFMYLVQYILTHTHIHNICLYGILIEMPQPKGGLSGTKSVQVMRK